MGVKGIGSRLQMTCVKVQLLLDAGLGTKDPGQFRDGLAAGVGVCKDGGSIGLARRPRAGDQEDRGDLRAGSDHFRQQSSGC